MMQFPLLLALGLLLNASGARAADKPLTPEEIQSRLEIKGEIYVLDTSGKHLQYANCCVSTWRSSSDKAPIDSHWGSSSNRFGSVYLHHRWTVEPDGSIKVLVEEYGKEVNDRATGNAHEFKNLLARKTLTLVDFAPITWDVQNNHKQHVVVRLTPSLRVQDPLVDASAMPIAGRDITVIDSQGYAWVNGFGRLDGTYVALATFRGTIAMSFKPFKGAAPVGTASGNLVTLAFPGDLRLTVRSATDFLPAWRRAKVYALYLPDRRTSSIHSTNGSDSSDEQHFLDAIQKPLGH